MLSQTSSYTINIGGTLLSMHNPLVMGILNVTPDSFYCENRFTSNQEIARRVDEMIDQEVDIIDIGGYSSRPGASEVSLEEEYRRVCLAIDTARRIAPHIPLSIDTFRSEIVRRCHSNFGNFIVNDISGGNLDADMFTTISDLQLPYVLTHMRGTPTSMMLHTDYSPHGVLTSVINELAMKVSQLQLLGVNDIIIDPGFGFSKTVEQNYALLNHLEEFGIFNKPLLVGISRKSMIYKPLHTDASHSLTGTTALHAIALAKGANILRVHDVKQARECITLTSMLSHSNPNI